VTQRVLLELRSVGVHDFTTAVLALGHMLAWGSLFVFAHNFPRLGEKIGSRGAEVSHNRGGLRRLDRQAICFDRCARAGFVGFLVLALDLWQR
jgi:hypothetical protein